MSNRVVAQVVASPTLLNLLDFPAAVPEARRLAADQAMAGTAFRSGLAAAVAAEENLSFAGVRRWLKEYFGSYEECVLESVVAPLDVLALDIHVPRVDGASAKVAVERSTSSTASFLVTLFGSGAGAKQTLLFRIDDGLEVSACTRHSYVAEATWELVEVVAGPDTGHHFHRMVGVDQHLLRTETQDVVEDPCGPIDPAATSAWHTFDYSEGAVVTGSPAVHIARADAWLGRTGLKLPGLGVDVSVDSEVARNAEITVEYRLPGGRTYEAHRDVGAPFPWWRHSGAQATMG